MSQDIINKNQDISYTNLDFSSIYTEVVDLAKQLSYRWDPSISDESDPGVVLLKLSSLIADKMNYNIDKSILESFPLSVTQDSSAKQLYEQLGYYMNWYESASVLINLSWIGEVPSDEETIVYTIPKFTIITDSESSRSYALIGTIDSNGIVVSDIKLPRDRTVVQAVAIEGTPVRFTFLGESTITPEMIDENNRLYLDTQFVAQNGIFIRNAGNDQDNFLEWRRVENLYEQPYNDLRYKLGIDTSADVAYLEFPDNYAELIGSGIEITYMVIDPDYSDVPAQVLDRFLVSVNPVEDANTFLSYDTVKIENVYASAGHKNKETIDEAYANYKRTVGTFKTLITLRDYLNYILLEGEELCSNGFVTDRTNDPQLTYKIMSKLNGLDSLITEVEAIEGYQTVNISQEDYKPGMYYIYIPEVEGEAAHMELDYSSEYDKDKIYFLAESEDKLTPFSLKLYLLQDAVAVNSKATFEQTFDMIATEDLPSIDALLEDTSHIQHTYEDILPFGENTYKKTEDTKRETTKSYYNYDKNSQRYEFISNSYYRPCGPLERNPFVYINIEEDAFAPNVYFYKHNDEFALCTNWSNDLFVSAGEITQFKNGITYYTRIGSGTSQDPYEYVKATVFEEGVDYYIVDLYTTGTFYRYNIEYDYYYTYEMPTTEASIKAVDPYALKLYVLEDLTGVDNINPKTQGWYEIDIEALSPHIAYFRAKYPINMDITTFTVVGREVQNDIKANILNALYENLNSTQLEFGDKIELDYLTEIVLGADTRIKSVVFANIEYRIEAMYYDKTHGFVGITLPTEITPPVYSDKDSVYSYNICKDIFAKSILAGRTKLLDKDTQFEYHLNQSYLDTIDNIYSMEPEATIDMSAVASIEADNNYISKNYTLKENETLTLFQPKLNNSRSYEKGVHFEYLIFNDIKAGDSYKLSSSEYMVFYTSVTDENNVIDEYKCNVYTNGAIIKPSFDLKEQSKQSSLSKYFTTEILPVIYNKEDFSYEYSTSSSYWTDYIKNDPSIINNVIEASDDITIQLLSEVTITPSDGYQFYWVLNKENKAESTGKKFYQLFGSYDSVNDKKQNGLINTYTLKNGEALYYMDKDGKNLAILHAGDSITRNTGASTEYVPVNEDELFTYIPVIINNNFIDLDEYNIRFIENEEGEISPLENGFYEYIDYEKVLEGSVFNPNETYYIYNEEAEEYEQVEITEFDPEVTYYTFVGNYKLSDDTAIDITKSYYVLVMNSMSGFYESHDDTYTPSPSTTYNIFKQLKDVDEDEILDIDPSSSEYNYFEKVTSQGIEIEDIYPAGNDVKVTYNPDETLESKWKVSGDLEESIVSRPRFRHANDKSILNTTIDIGDFKNLEVNDTYTYLTDPEVTIDKSSAIAYSPSKQKLHEVTEYHKVNITEFRDDEVYYTRDSSGEYIEVEGEYVEVESGTSFNPARIYYIEESGEYEKVEITEFEEGVTYYTYDRELNSYQTYYIGPKFYTFYSKSTNATLRKRAYITESEFNERGESGIQYYKASSFKQPSMTRDRSEPLFIKFTYPNTLNGLLLNAYSSIAQEGVVYFIDDYEDMIESPIPLEISPGETLPSTSELRKLLIFVKKPYLCVRATQFPDHLLPVNLERSATEEFESYYNSKYLYDEYITNVVTGYHTVTGSDTFEPYAWYYRDVMEDTYPVVTDITTNDIPTTNNWYERDEYDSSIDYYVFNKQSEDFDKVYIGAFDPEVEYFYKEDGTFYSIYHQTSKVYSYEPLSIARSIADTPFIKIDEDAHGGLGCYYKVGTNDRSYIKSTVNEEHITLSATLNNLPQILYDSIRNYRIRGKALSEITVADIDANWDQGYSIAYPSDFYIKDFIKDTSAARQYYAIDITTYGNTIKTVLSDNMGSVHTIFPYYGTIDNLQSSYIIVDKSLYEAITNKIPEFDSGVPVKFKPGSAEYTALTDKTLQTWYTIIETLVGTVNRPYVYIYFIPEYYRFRYLLTTNADIYYVLKDYVDKEFGIVDPWECDKITSTLLANNPALALTNLWKPLQDNCSVTLRQNDLYTLTEGDTITLTSEVNSSAITWPKFTNTEIILNGVNYSTSYTKANNEIVSLDNISITGAEWRAYSNLLINTSTGKGQQLASTHKITFYDKDNEVIATIPDDLNAEKYDPKKITMFQLEHPINNKTGDYVQAFTYDDLGNEVLNSAYVYEQLLSHEHKDEDENKYDIKYSSDNNTSIILYNDNGRNNVAELQFVFPKGKYLIPMQGVKDSGTRVAVIRENDVSTGYYKTPDIAPLPHKIYYDLTITGPLTITDFEEGINYYQIGTAPYAGDAYGLTTSTVPVTGVDYYTISSTEIKITEAYAKFDTTTGTLTFFRDEPGVYENKQIIDNCIYYTGIETTEYNDQDLLVPWSNKIQDISYVNFEDTVSPISTVQWFATDVITDNNIIAVNNLNKLDTSNVTNMSRMFSTCKNITSLDLSNFDTSKVTSMFGMFSGMSNIESLDLSTFDTSEVTKMNGMFSGCVSLIQIFASSVWDTTSVTLSNDMFYECTELVGGNGTVYSSSHTDKTYARIDTQSTPGYFTAKDYVAPINSGITNYTNINDIDITSLYEFSDNITLNDVSVTAIPDYSSDTTLFNEDRIYYLYVNNTTEDLGTISFRCNTSTDMTTLVLGDLFKYDNKYDDFIHGQVLEKMKAFDTDHIFNYTYQPADNELIDNPVQPKSFWDKNHVYNPYTIAQLDTSSTDNINYRFITSK